MEDPLNRAPDCTSDPRAKPEASRESSAMLLYEVVNSALHALKIVADTSCHPGNAAIIAESHRYVLRARGMDLPEDLIDELARNAAHVLALTAEANEAKAEGAG